jgi:plastocyanin
MKPAPIVFAALLAAGCGAPPPPQKTAAEIHPTVEYFHVDPATAGSVAGKVVFHGAKPAPTIISMNSDAGCSKAHGGKPVSFQPVVTSKDGGLTNAFVYIQAGLEGKKFEPSKEPVTLDQHGCMFTPRLLGIQAGQPLDLKNSDAVSHNVHPLPQNNREWNEQQSPGAPDIQHKFARTEIMIPVKCNIHSWMRGYIGVTENPYFAVTGADGSFELKSLPPGDYTVAVWHETLGQKQQQVHVAASGSAAVNFSYP